MEGVRILTQSEVVAHVATPPSLIMGLFIISAIFCSVALINFFSILLKEKYIEKVFIFPFIVFLLMSIGLFNKMKSWTPTTYETQYLVEVTDADFVEFYNKYEILEDKRNNVFVVKEKGN